MAEEIQIPELVVNEEAYRKYVRLKETPALKQENRMIDTSDIHCIVDPKAPTYTINKKIAHLPEKEQEEILKRVRAFKAVVMRIHSLRASAYGKKRRKIHNDLVMGVLDERASEIIEYFGAMYTVEEVHKVLVMDWGYQIRIGSLRSFKNKNQELIDKKIEEYKSDWSGIRIANRRGRLEEYAELYGDWKAKYESTPNKTNLDMLLRMLKEARDETKDETLRIEANINANIELNINKHIQEEVMAGLTINDIIIARVAARMGINPRFIITRLHNSLYSKLSGFVQPDTDLHSQEIQYPSTMVYNWKDIKKQHQDVGDANIEDAEWEEVDQEKKDEGSDVKALLLQKIKDKRQKAANAKGRVRTKKDLDNK